MAEQYQANREAHKRVTFRSNIRKKYGMTPEQYAEALARGCYVCGSSHLMVIDHDHKRNVVREALCTACNVAIGMADDSPERLEALAAYLREMERTKTEPIPPARDPRILDIDPGAIRLLYEEGKTQEQIAEFFSCSRPLISILMKRNDIPTRRAALAA